MKNTVYISAGHSEHDPGAVNTLLNLREADLTRGLRNLVLEKLQGRGLAVKSDGMNMVNLARDTAIRKAAEYDGLKIDFHFNSSNNVSARGVETFSDAAHKHIAQELSHTVAAVIGSEVRGDEGWKGRTESQHGKRGLAWLDRLENSLLLEVCFISNPREIRAYLANIDRVAEAIATVILKYST